MKSMFSHVFKRLLTVGMFVFSAVQICAMHNSGERVLPLKVNGEALSIVHQQIHLQHFGALSNALEESLPRELIHLILDYSSPTPVARYSKNCARPECVQKIRAHQTPITCILPLRDGGGVSAAWQDGQCKIWNWNTKLPLGLNLRKVLNTGIRNIKCLLQLANGNLVIGGSSPNNHGIVQIWDLKTNSLKHQDTQQNNVLCMVSFIDGDHEFIAYGCSDGMLAILDSQNYNNSILIPHDSPIFALAALPKGHLLYALKNGKLGLWGVKEKKLLSESPYINAFELNILDQIINFLVPLNEKTILFASYIAFEHNSYSAAALGFINLEKGKSQEFTKIGSVQYLSRPFGHLVKSIKKFSDGTCLVVVHNTMHSSKVDIQNLQLEPIRKTKHLKK